MEALTIGHDILDRGGLGKEQAAGHLPLGQGRIRRSVNHAAIGSRPLEDFCKIPTADLAPEADVRHENVDMQLSFEQLDGLLGTACLYDRKAGGLEGVDHGEEKQELIFDDHDDTGRGGWGTGHWRRAVPRALKFIRAYPQAGGAAFCQGTDDARESFHQATKFIAGVAT